MTQNEIKQNDTESIILEGDVLSPQQRQHLFRNKTAMLDWLKWSNVESATFRSGILQSTGEKVFELIYNTSEN